MKRFNPPSTLLALAILIAVFTWLILTHKPRTPQNPMNTETGKKAAQSIRDARGW